MRIAVPSLLLSLALAGPALAASPQVGEEAPDFDQVSWVLNPPRQASVKALRGEVVFVEKWGVKCPPCLALIPHVQKLQEEFGGRGLNIFAFEAQNHGADEVKKTVEGRGGKSYAVSAGGANNYRTNGGIPHGWLIGVDGKVVWEGNPGDGKFDQLLRAEMAKVRFPGLGRNDFDPALNKALERYTAKKDVAGARKEARKVLEAKGSSEKARADAQDLIDRLTGLATRRAEEAQAAEAAGDWVTAMDAWGWLAQSFGKEPEGEPAKARLDELKKDEKVKKELDAHKRLEALLAQLAGRPAEEKKAALAQFAKSDKVAGTNAAKRAEELSR
jgi:thiol-disulfide isomerase/thioredoxin